MVTALSAALGVVVLAVNFFLVREIASRRREAEAPRRLPPLL